MTTYANLVVAAESTLPVNGWQIADYRRMADHRSDVFELTYTVGGLDSTTTYTYSAHIIAESSRAAAAMLEEWFWSKHGGDWTFQINAIETLR